MLSVDKLQHEMYLNILQIVQKRRTWHDKLQHEMYLNDRHLYNIGIPCYR